MTATYDLVIAADASCKFIECIPGPFNAVFRTILGIAGVFVLVGGLLKAAGKITQGLFPQAVRIGIFSLVFATLLLFPGTIDTLISGVSKLVELIGQSISGLGGGGGGGTPAPSPGPVAPPTP